MPIDDKRIPDAVLRPIAIRYKLVELKCDPSKWSDYDIQRIRVECGAEWAAIPLENIRNQCEGLRKLGELGTDEAVKNHGAMSVPKPPPEYEEYLMSNWWRTFRVKVLKWWDYRCALCYSDKKVDIHHRTYNHLGNEQLNDCVALCRKCHQQADRMRKRAIKNEESVSMLFAMMEK